MSFFTVPLQVKFDVWLVYGMKFLVPFRLITLRKILFLHIFKNCKAIFNRDSRPYFGACGSIVISNSLAK
jgi:hypothetical protein